MCYVVTYGIGTYIHMCYVYARLEKSRVFLQIPFLLSNHSTIILRPAILTAKISASNNALKPWPGKFSRLTGIFKPNRPRNCRYFRDSIQTHLELLILKNVSKYPGQIII